MPNSFDHCSYENCGFRDITAAADPLTEEQAKLAEQENDLIDEFIYSNTKHRKFLKETGGELGMEDGNRAIACAKLILRGKCLEFKYTQAGIPIRVLRGYDNKKDETESDAPKKSESTNVKTTDRRSSATSRPFATPQRNPSTNERTSHGRDPMFQGQER